MKIETKRLYITPASFDDKEELIAIANDESITKGLSSFAYPFGEKEANEWLRKVTQDDYKALFLREKSSLKLLGAIIIDISKEHNHATLSYFLAKEYRNRGFMSEALEAVVNFCFEELDLIRVAAHHFHTNLASKRVLQKSGFELEGIRKKHFKKEDKYLDIYDYGIIRRDIC